MPLIEPYEDNMDPDIHEKPDDGKCPVCGNSRPRFLVIDDWGEVVGCSGSTLAFEASGPGSKPGTPANFRKEVFCWL